MASRWRSLRRFAPEVYVARFGPPASYRLLSDRSLAHRIAGDDEGARAEARRRYAGAVERKAGALTRHNYTRMRPPWEADELRTVIDALADRLAGHREIPGQRRRLSSWLEHWARAGHRGDFGRALERYYLHLGGLGTEVRRAVNAERGIAVRDTGSVTGRPAAGLLDRYPAVAGAADPLVAAVDSLLAGDPRAARAADRLGIPAARAHEVVAQLNQDAHQQGLGDRIDVSRVLRALQRRGAASGQAPDGAGEAALADAGHLMHAIDGVVALGWPAFYSSRLDRPRQLFRQAAVLAVEAGDDASGGEDALSLAAWRQGLAGEDPYEVLYGSQDGVGLAAAVTVGVGQQWDPHLVPRDAWEAVAGLVLPFVDVPAAAGAFEAITGQGVTGREALAEAAVAVFVAATSTGKGPRGLAPLVAGLLPVSRERAAVLAAALLYLLAGSRSCPEVSQAAGVDQVDIRPLAGVPRHRQAYERALRAWLARDAGVAAWAGARLPDVEPGAVVAAVATRLVDPDAGGPPAAAVWDRIRPAAGAAPISRRFHRLLEGGGTGPCPCTAA